jgi:hypothetical protein
VSLSMDTLSTASFSPSCPIPDSVHACMHVCIPAALLHANGCTYSGQSRAGGRDRSESDKAGKPRKSTTHPSHPDTVCARTHPGCNSNRIASRHISIAAASSKSPSSRARILAHSHHRRRRRSRLFPLPDVSRYYWGLAAIVLSLPRLVAALGWWSMACSAGRLLPGQTHTHSHHPPILSLP